MQAKTNNKVYSARYIATDKETGEVLGSADTYEEALNEWGEEVRITDSEATEGDKEMNLFQSKKPIKSEVDYDMSYEKEFDDMVEENGYDVNDQFAYMIGIPPEYWTKEDSKACTEYDVKVHGYYILGAEIEGMVVTGRLQDIYDVCDQHFGIGIAPECLSPIDSFDYEDGEWFTGRWLGSSNKSDNAFFTEIVSKVLTHDMSEEQAIKKIASRKDCNIGFAKNIFNEAMKNPDYIDSGVMAIADDLNKDFDLDGNIDSWTKEYMENSGNSTTLGGEILRAFNRIDYRYYNDGDMIGRGYGKETVNPAARFLVEKCVGWTEVGNLEDMLNGESDINKSDDYYNEWLEDLKYSLEDYLRNHEEFFHTPNKDDMLNYGTEDDKDAGVTECYFEDGDGNTYWFENDGSGDWQCYKVEFANTPEFEVGDTVSSVQLEHHVDFGDEDDYLDFEIEGYQFSAERVGDDEWEITNIEVEGAPIAEGDWWSTDDLLRETLYDSNGNELSEKDLY